MSRGLAGSASSFWRRWPMKTRRYCTSSSIGRAPDGGQQLAVGQHPAVALGQTRQQIVFPRRQAHRLASAGHQPLDQVDGTSPALTTGGAPA